MREIWQGKAKCRDVCPLEGPSYTSENKNKIKILQTTTAKTTGKI